MTSLLYSERTAIEAMKQIERHGLTDVHRMLIEMVGYNKRVLEIGCASGYMTKELQSRGCSVDAVEVHPLLASQAGKSGAKVIQADIEDAETLNLLSPPYQVILMSDVIEHLVDPFGVLARLKELLDSFGYLLVTFPNVLHYRMRWRFLLGRFEYSETGILDWTHLRFFTFDSFKRYFSEAGLELLEYRISEGSYPLMRLFKHIPGINRLGQSLIERFPNLLGAHFIFKGR